MSNSITPFAFGDHMVRVQMDEHGNPWFVRLTSACPCGKLNFPEL